MAELYSGTKFRTTFTQRDPPADERIPELVQWCRRFAELGLASEGAGNLSFRSASGFIVSRTAADLASIEPEEFVEVIRTDPAKREVTASGAHEPSSESLTHAAIYGARPDVNAVFHGHSDELLGAATRLGLPLTEREHPYGTPELAAEVVTMLRGHLLLVIRNHGALFLGRTMRESGRRAERVLAQVAGW